MNCRFILIISFCFIATFTGAQERHFVAFTDKNGSTFSINNPEQFLTERAIARRSKQNIAINETDLPVNQSYINQVESTGAKALYPLKWFNGVVVEATDSQLVLIQALPFVVNANRVSRTSIHLNKNKFEPLDEVPTINGSRTMALNYGAAAGQINIHNGEFLHNLGFKGQEMWIGVFDAGFSNANQNRAFDSLEVSNRLIHGLDVVAIPGANVFSFDSHGTQVLSCMAANLPGEMIGTAPSATYIPVRTENNFMGSELIIEEYNWARGAEYADSLGVDLINSSLGYYSFDNSSQDHTYQDMDGNTTPITRAADLAAEKGILVVTSAGNEGNRSWRYITAPADADSVLTVGAVNLAGIKVGFSSVGPTADGRIKPNVMAVGGNTSIVNPGGNVAVSNGTSFSSPIMCGLAACLWQAFPKANNMDILKAIEQSADRAENPDFDYGYGIPNFEIAYNILSEKFNPIVFDDAAFISPNPSLTNQNVTLSLKLVESEEVTLFLYDINGRIIGSRTEQVLGQEFQQIILNNYFTMNTGVFVLDLKLKSGSRRFKIIRN